MLKKKNVDRLVSAWWDSHKADYQSYSLSLFLRNCVAAANTSATWPAPPIMVPTSVTLTLLRMTYSRDGSCSFCTQCMQSTGQEAIASCKP